MLVAGLLAVTSCSNSNSTSSSTPTSSSSLAVHIVQPTPPLGSNIDFSATVNNANGQIKETDWDFGDGQTSHDIKTSHQYQKSGDYNVKISVTDEKGKTAQDSMTAKVQVGPSAQASVGPAGGDNIHIQFISDEAPLQVAFNSDFSKAEPGGMIAKYHWDFGDGQTSDEKNPSHTYKNLGEYQVLLTVTDQNGLSDQSQVTVRVIAYEAVKETLPLDKGPVEYELYSKNIRNLSGGPSMFYQYVVHTDRRLTADEIGKVIDDIIAKAQKRPRIDTISVQLFDQVIDGFMVPREYAHYLGMSIWDHIENKSSVTLNDHYVDGTAIRVTGYTDRENPLLPGDEDCGDLCNKHNIGLVDLFLEGDSLCFVQVDTTFREVAQWRLSANYDGYLVTIYERDKPIAWAIGTREGGPKLEELPLRYFNTPPGSWNNKKDPNLWIHYSSLPACPKKP
jgi:PKD repeat protein